MVPEVEKLLFIIQTTLPFLIGSNSPANSLICYTAGNFEAVNSLNLAVMVVVSQHWQVNSALLPSDVIVFAMSPLRDFGGKQFHCLMSCDLEVTNNSTHCWEKLSSDKTITYQKFLSSGFIDFFKPKIQGLFKDFLRLFFEIS